MRTKNKGQRCALVTGGSRGIGRAICLQLAADHGLKVYINYMGNTAAAETTLQQIKEAGGEAEILRFDVTDPEQVRQALQELNNEEQYIDVIVNNAGITKDNLFVWLEEEDWHSVIDTSLTGFYNVTRTLIQNMIVNRSGRIVNVVSLSGLKGTPGQTNYSAAKGAMIAATKALAQEVAKRKITVNAVAPGFITTDMTSELNEGELKKLVPAARFGTAEEVAHLVSFLVSDKSAYITGEVININGGLYS